MAGLTPDKYPSMKESIWHFGKMMQYQCSNDKQRRCQALIDAQFAQELRYLRDIVQEQLPDKGDSIRGLLSCTRAPSISQLGRFYGKTQNSLYNNLPVPEVKYTNGVAYSSMRSVIQWLLANGIPMDNTTLNVDNAQ